jgi:hypothetical protein
MAQSHTDARTILVEFPDGRTAIILQIQIDCPDCGTHTYTIEGHHLPVIKQIVDQTIASHPKETQSRIQQTDRVDFVLGPPDDPTRN